MFNSSPLHSGSAGLYECFLRDSGRESGKNSMRTIERNLILIFLLATTVALCATLKSASTIDLPGPPGKRFDYLTIDYDDRYLLSAHLAAGLLYVIDLRTNLVVKAIPDAPGIEGVEFVPELKKVYTSNAGDNTIGVIDLRQMKVIKKLPTEAKCLCCSLSQALRFRRAW